MTIGRWSRWKHTTGHWSLWHRGTRGEDKMLCGSSVPSGVAKLTVLEEAGDGQRCLRCCQRLRRIERRPASMDQRDFRNLHWS